MNIKNSIRKIKKRFIGGFGLILLSERYCWQIALASKFPGDESAATAQLAAMRTQAKLPPGRASVLPSR